MEVTKAADDAAAEGVEVIEGVLEEASPEAGEIGVVRLSRLQEEGFIFSRGVDLAEQIFCELRDENGMGELLKQDRGEIEIAMEVDAVALEIAEDAEERKVGFGGGFVEPLHAVRPGAVVDDVGQMGVQGKGEKSGRRSGSLHHGCTPEEVWLCSILDGRPMGDNGG